MYAINLALCICNLKPNYFWWLSQKLLKNKQKEEDICFYHAEEIGIGFVTLL